MEAEGGFSVEFGIEAENDRQEAHDGFSRVIPFVNGEIIRRLSVEP